jgi:hypothetical protein
VISQAIPAQAGEGHLTLIHSAAYLTGSGRHQLLRHLHLGQIHHRTALHTEEVNMGHCVAVKPFYTLDRTNGDRQALLLKQVQIPVDRS